MGPTQNPQVGTALSPARRPAGWRRVLYNRTSIHIRTTSTAAKSRRCSLRSSRRRLCSSTHDHTIAIRGTMTEPFWSPTDEQVRNAGLTKFREYVNARYVTNMRDYWDLHRWSIGSPREMNEYWTALWDWSGVIGEKGAPPVSFDLHTPQPLLQRYMTDGPCYSCSMRQSRSPRPSDSYPGRE